MATEVAFDELCHFLDSVMCRWSVAGIHSFGRLRQKLWLLFSRRKEEMMRSLRIFWVFLVSLSLIVFVGRTSLLMASTSPSHATHFFSDKGPHILLDEIGCYTCHANGRLQCQVAPAFADGTEEVPVFLETTTVCDGCHSAGGKLDGVTMAKLNWEYGVYEAGGTALKSGKEMWCISCHDAGASICNGVSAPNISGDNTTYGYYVNGHRSKLCSDCHDLTVTHIDGEARTYRFNNEDVDPVDGWPDMYGSANSGIAYASGYRLRYVDGEVPLMIPANYSNTFGSIGQDMLDNGFRLCFSCHDYTKIFDDTFEDGLDTNFKASLPNPPQEYSYSWSVAGDINQHVLHVRNYTMQAWDSDWDPDTVGPGPGVGCDSMTTCSSCHNVHGAAGAQGSTNEPMIRDGSLVGREPGYGFSYVVEDVGSGGYPQVTSTNATLPISVGAVFREDNAMCFCCHLCPTPSDSSYDATGAYLEYYRAVGTFNCSDCHAYGTEASHPTHDDSTGKGVDLECYGCHDSGGHVNNTVDFPDGNPLPTTSACDACHSSGGVHGGVAMAKDNWGVGIYEEDGKTLQSDKEQWCAGCHDDVPANSKADGTGIYAPNVMGDGAGVYGYYISGHGRPGADVECLGCHDASFAHIDGEPRTYDVDDSYLPATVINEYVDSYRLNANLDVPRSFDEPGQYELCIQCHTHVFGSNRSNFIFDRTPIDLLHDEHMLFDLPVWDSNVNGPGDGSGAGKDSAMTCPTCHNPHGTQMNLLNDPNPPDPCKVMIRDGQLTELTKPTDERYGLYFHWYTEGNGVGGGGELTSDLVASRSGQVLTRPPFCAWQPCHGAYPYYNREGTPLPVGTTIISESFEGAGEEAWTETIGDSCILDEDSSIPGTPPVDFGSQCLQSISGSSGYEARADLAYSSEQAYTHTTFYVYVESEDLANNEFKNIGAWLDGSGSTVAVLRLFQGSAGNLKIRLRLYNNSGYSSYNSAAISLNTWYKVEFKYDANNNWEYKIDGTTRGSGSLGFHHRTGVKQWRLGFWQSNQAKIGTIYFDELTAESFD